MLILINGIKLIKSFSHGHKYYSSQVLQFTCKKYIGINLMTNQNFLLLISPTEIFEPQNSVTVMGRRGRLTVKLLVYLKQLNW